MKNVFYSCQCGFFTTSPYKAYKHECDYTKTSETDFILSEPFQPFDGDEVEIDLNEFSDRMNQIP